MSNKILLLMNWQFSDNNNCLYYSKGYKEIQRSTVYNGITCKTDLLAAT